MEFRNQDKQNQRGTERFILMFFTIYTISLVYGVIQMEWPAWIPSAMVIGLLSSWGIHISNYKNHRTRVTFTAVMIQLCCILYAANMDDMIPTMPTVIAMTLFVAFYGVTEVLWINILSVLFIVFYHGVIVESFVLSSWGDMLHLLSQIANIFCVEYIIYFWVKKRNENTQYVYKMIEALIDAEQSKDDFLANVSHEIRTPVNTICGISEIALREHDKDKLREYLFNIQDAGRNLMSLVSDILDFSQLQQGKIDTEEEAYNITSTINDIINMAVARRGEKNIEFIIDCDADIPSSLLGDEKKIRRVIMNLMDNAVKFTNEGCITFFVRARKEDYGVNLCISVKDTGIGMTQDSLEHVFESFNQVDTKRNRRGRGIGLGLSISKAMVQKMGGTITARSRLGRGSIFRVVIPQKVLDEKPIVEVEHREELNVATYIDMEQFNMSTIRDDYSSNIANMVHQLRLKWHACRNLAELKRRNHREKFSHVFITLVEYQEDPAYFDELAKELKLIVVLNRGEEKYLSNPDLLRLYKPFYILPVVSILNGGEGAEDGQRTLRKGKFIAPDAHLLVVDDNQMNIRVVEGLLKEYQIRVSSVTSGRDALKKIENKAYDFVFMDHMMPEMDGIETFHRIRDKQGLYYQQVPIVALTANAAPGNRERFLEEGFSDFIAKPIEISVLERVLKRNLPEEKLIFIKKGETAASLMGDRMDSNQEIASTEEQQSHSAVKEQDSAEGEQTSGSKTRLERWKESEEKLVIGDLDVDKGMLYCGGRNTYLDILEGCCLEMEDVCQALDGFLQEKDWKNYTIKVHALKGMMLNIGASFLAESAKELERAGKKENVDYILKNHGKLLTEYRRMIQELAEILEVSIPSPEEMGQDVGLVDDSGKSSVPDGEQGAQTEEQKETLPELEEDEFDFMLAELEDVSYQLDGEQMLSILSHMEDYQYHGILLRTKLTPVKNKVEQSDYMSAVALLEKIRKDIQEKQKGGAAV